MRVSRFLLVSSLAFGVAIAAASAPPSVFAAPRVASDNLGAPPAGAKRYVVRFADSAKQAEIDALLKNIESAGRGKKRLGLANVFKGSIIDLEPAALQTLMASGKVAWVEADQRVTASATQDVSQLWGLDRIDQRTLPLNGKYSYDSDGAGVTAYIVDTGILATHVDFSSRVRAGYDAFGGNTIDCNGHGTHVAGTVGGSTYGVAKAATLVAVRVLDCAGSGSTSSVIASIDWAIADHTSGPAVLNMSLGGGFSQTLNAAVDRAVADGITVVVAAGNSNADACATSPASATSALTVGATISSDSRASYSNFGSCLDVFAPGSGITSTYYTSTSATATLSGTSMASPHVAGAAARYLGLNPTASPASVSAAVLAQATSAVVSAAGSGSPNLLLNANFVVPIAPTTTTPAPTTTSTTLAPTTTTSTTTSTTTTLVSTTTTTKAPRTRPRPPKKLVASYSGDRSWVMLTWVDDAETKDTLKGHVVAVYEGPASRPAVVLTDGPSGQVARIKIRSTRNQSYQLSFTVSAQNPAGLSDPSERSNQVVIPSRRVIESKPLGGYVFDN